MANDMTGSLSKNERKEKPSHANYSGSIVIEGRRYWLNRWVKEGNSGKKFLSLSARLAEERVERKPAPAAVDDSIPF
jgi:hypothetical protein